MPYNSVERSGEINENFWNGMNSWFEPATWPTKTPVEIKPKPTHEIPPLLRVLGFEIVKIEAEQPKIIQVLR